MANVRSTDNDARLIEQEARGRRVRYVACKGISVDTNRATIIMATAIQNETVILPMFVAPCDGKVVRITSCGSPFVDMAAGGSVNAKLTKAVIGDTNIDLCTDMLIGDATVPTADTAIDAVLSTTATDLNLLNGQHVYATVVVSNHTVDVAGYVTLMMEFVPTDVSYATS